jgi:hypothetical protein
MTREEWLNQLTEALRPVFAGLSCKLPEKLRASCGWPSERALSRKRRVIGECWYPMCSADATTEVFVSPVQSDGLEVAETLAHELVHAAVGEGHGHKGKFITVAKALGFTKPWKSTPATDELKAKLRGLLPGAYPHASLDQKFLDKEKPAGTRMLKVVCANCEYTVRVTRKWLETGAPICPCNKQPMEEVA